MPRTEAAEHEAIVAEHAELRRVLEDIDAAFRGGPDTAGGGWRDELLRGLRTLHPLLQAHYAREEAGGLFDSIREAEPAAGHACDRLAGQHAAHLTELDSLVHALENTPRDSRESLAGRARALLDSISQHEREENALLAEVFETDTGAQD